MASFYQKTVKQTCTLELTCEKVKELIIDGIRRCNHLACEKKIPFSFRRESLSCREALTRRYVLKSSKFTIGSFECFNWTLNLLGEIFHCSVIHFYLVQRKKNIRMERWAQCSLNIMTPKHGWKETWLNFAETDKKIGFINLKNIHQNEKLLYHQTC